MITTIQKWGNSKGVRLPKSILDNLSMQENDTVEIMAEDDYIIIKKTARRRRARKSLEERFEGYTGNYQCEELDWGAPVGKERWWEEE